MGLCSVILTIICSNSLLSCLDATYFVGLRYDVLPSVSLDKVMCIDYDVILPRLQQGFLANFAYFGSRRWPKPDALLTARLGTVE